MKRKRRRRRQIRAALSLAAVIALMVVLTTAAVANNWFGLRTLLLPEQMVLPAGQGGRTEPEIVDAIGLQGYADSPESQALAEWQAFLEGYDSDGAILASIGNGPTGLEGEPAYECYGAYTREMADKLQEIADKYHLALHTEMRILEHAELIHEIGGEFLSETHAKYSAYIYEDGTFQCDGDAVLDPFGTVDYQLRRSVKGSFDEVFLNITDFQSYQEWQYQTACGETVTLSLGPYKGLILMDRPDCFLTVNVLAGSDPAGDGIWPGGLTASDLEQLADGIDFTVLKTVRTPAAGETQSSPVEPVAPVVPSNNEPTVEPVAPVVPSNDELTVESVAPVVPSSSEPSEADDPLYGYTGFTASYVENFKSVLLELVEDKNWYSLSELFCYPLSVTTMERETHIVETPAELQPYLEEIDPEKNELLAESPNLDTIVEHLAEELRTGDLFYADGKIGIGDGSIWIGMLDERICVMTMQDVSGAWTISMADTEITAG